MSWNVQLQKICQKTITQTASHPSSWRFALRHWFRESDWLPILEVTLALDEESTGRAGDEGSLASSITCTFSRSEKRYCEK
jgi:hypothetical protein